MDGVIVDTEKLYLQALQLYLNAQGKTVEIFKLTKYLGLSMKDISIQLKQDYDIVQPPDKIRENQLLYYDDLFYKEGNVIPMPGLLDVMKILKRHDIRTALVSSSSMWGIKETLQMIHMETYFDHLVSASDLSRGKPYPDVYQYTVNQMGIDAKHVFVFEDSKAGIQSAKSANLKVIGFKGSSIEQDTSQADYEVHDFYEFIHYLKESNKKP